MSEVSEVCDKVQDAIVQLRQLHVLVTKCGLGLGFSETSLVARCTAEQENIRSLISYLRDHSEEVIQCIEDTPELAADSKHLEAFCKIQEKWYGK